MMRGSACKALPVLLCALLFACSSANKKQMSFQAPNEAWWQSASASKSASTSEKNLATVRQKMTKVVPFPFTVGITDSVEINAYAHFQDQKSYVIFTSGFIGQFGNDPDVLASVLGHELAHHQLGHTQPDYAKTRDLAIDATSQALGMIASYFIPFSGLLVGNAAKGAGLSFSRDDERSADYQGMQWAQQAGYSACGSYRFAAKMNSLGEGASLAFLSTHPGNSERMENAAQFVQANRATPCGSDPSVIQSSKVSN
jgi:predicted Zn-dependent protease